VVWRTLGTARPVTGWAGAAYSFTVPAGATSVRLAHTLGAVGVLDVDGVSLNLKPAPAPAKHPVTPTGSKPAPAASGKGLVSVTFDDGTADHYSQAAPVLKADGLPGTFYLISGYLGGNGYVTVAQAKQMQAAGNEIGSHTVDHPHLTQLTAAQVDAELGDSKKALEANFGPVTDLAYPYGTSNATVQQIVAKYYASARSTDSAPNVPGKYNKYSLTIGYVLNTTSVATIKQWVADAQAKNTWLILCYHGIADGKPGETYVTSVGNFTSAMANLKSSGVRVVTVHDGLKLTGN
jgi:peptidoglycan/xylan/chitin deacetylase (PgdA/CDA1 family)